VYELSAQMAGIAEQPTELVKPIEEAQKHSEEPAQPNVYVVKQNDNLTKIAKMYNTTWQKLQEINKLKDPNMIYPNQEIKLP
jgi:LysM repeat protein